MPDRVTSGPAKSVVFLTNGSAKNQEFSAVSDAAMRAVNIQKRSRLGEGFDALFLRWGFLYERS